MATLGMVHTVHRVIPSLASLGQELLPGVRQLQFLDESVLQDAIAQNGLSPDIYRRVGQLVLLAAERSDVVLVTCSSIGPCVDAAAQMTGVPVLRIDEPMAKEAVRLGRSVGVVATLGSTLAPTAELVERAARLAEKEVEVRRVLCEGAFEAASQGRQQEHDSLVLAALQGLADEVDVIVLAQASMARVAELLPQPTRLPVLSSPRGGLLWAGEVLRRRVKEEQSCPHS